MSRSIAADMPQTFEFIQQMREAFGRETINAQIKRGMEGLPMGFYAEENGHTVGTKTEARGTWVSVADMELDTKQKPIEKGKMK